MGYLERGRVTRQASHLHRLVPPNERHQPVVTVHDAASHSLAWLGSALRTRQLALGVDRFGESGGVEDLHRATGIDIDDIVNAALISLYG